MAGIEHPQHFAEEALPDVPFGRVDAAVAPVFGFVDRAGIDAEEGVREVGVSEGGGVGEEEGDEETAEGAVVGVSFGFVDL